MAENMDTESFGTDTAQTLYDLLQQKSLEQVQLLSGKIWTDYHEHDPGVTILDLLNYVLWELDYQLSFDLEDYLTPEDGCFNPEDTGLFLPERVFQPSSVTTEDYRNLFNGIFPDVEDVQIEPHPYQPEDSSFCNGLYDIKIQLSAWADNPIRRKYIRKEIKRIFHQHRNLCESLHQIEFVNWEQLEIEANLDIQVSVNPTSLLASVYIEASKLFAISASRPVSIQSKLYKSIRDIPGVLSVENLKLTPPEKAGKAYTTIRFPKKKKEIKIILRNGNERIDIDFDKLSELLYHYRILTANGSSKIKADSPADTIPKGQHRAIYQYYSVQNDFPDCYGINRWGVTPSADDLRKAQAHQLKAYMLLFDLLFGQGLSELQDMQKWMKLNAYLPATGIPELNSDPLLQWDILTDPDVFRQVNEHHVPTLTSEKGKWLDVLDRLYGEDSNPAFLHPFNFYLHPEEENILRRIKFLQQVPYWGLNRFKGIDILNPSPQDRSGIEVYIASLLGFGRPKGHSVSNLFASYNLQVLDDHTFFRKFAQLLDYDLIMPSMPEEFMEDIAPDRQLWSDIHYDRLRNKIPLLVQGFIFETFLRDGSQIENYKIFRIPGSGTGLLLFHYPKTKEWKCLGRFTSGNDIAETANLLCNFLLMLNKQSETIYVVEHLLLRPVPHKEEAEEVQTDLDNMEEETDMERLPLEFSATIILSGSSTRTFNPLFRKETEKLIESQLPVHLNSCILWIPLEKTVWFEQLYFTWRSMMANEKNENINHISGTLASYLIKLRKEYDYSK